MLADIAEQAGDFLLPLYGFDNDVFSLGVDLVEGANDVRNAGLNERIGSASWSRRRHHHAGGSEGHPGEGRGPVMAREDDGGAPATRVYLWFDRDGPQIRVHTIGADFDAVKRDLKRLCARLSGEINRGPSECPLSPTRDL